MTWGRGREAAGAGGKHRVDVPGTGEEEAGTAEGEVLVLGDGHGRATGRREAALGAGRRDAG